MFYDNSNYTNEQFPPTRPTNRINSDEHLLRSKHIITLVSWKGGKPLSWDVTAVCLLWLIHMWQQGSNCTRAQAGAAAERAVELNIAKYSDLEDKCIFQPIAVESLGPLYETTCQFLNDLGGRISAQSGDERERERESAFLFQRLSVLMQRFRPNAILLHDS